MINVWTLYNKILFLLTPSLNILADSGNKDVIHKMPDRTSQRYLLRPAKPAIRFGGAVCYYAVREFGADADSEQAGICRRYVFSRTHIPPFSVA